MKRESIESAGEKKVPAGRVLSTWVEWQFALQLEEKAEARGLSVSQYLRKLVIDDVENVTATAILASLGKLEELTGRLDKNVHEFLRNTEVVAADG